MIEMQVIVVVLNKLDCLDDLLANLKRAGVRGGTIIESTGMIKTIDDSDESYLLGSLRHARKADGHRRGFELRPY